MLAKRLTPVLNVTNMQESFAWFEKFGWTKAWDWGSPPTFGAVCSGECEIFLSLDSQGGRGTSSASSNGTGTTDNGVWMCVMVEDVDAIYSHCEEQGLEVTWPPTDTTWGFREMHVRHPDGHVFRVGHVLDDDDDDDD